jgi:spermidine/putrescine transport system permease protein
MTTARSSSAPRLPSGLSIYFVALLIVLYLPIALLLVFSLHDNTVLSFPLRGLTLDWYRRVVEVDGLLRAARNSLVVGFASAAAATILGTMVAIAVGRYTFRGKALLIGLTVLPLLVPFVVLAVALLLLFAALDIQRSLWTIGLAHTVVCLPYVVLIVWTRVSGLDPYLEDAAMDLGADYPTTLRRVVVPILSPAILAAFLTAFTVSFDEFALALFLAGRDPTFPVYLYGQLRFANRLPIMIALAMLLLLGTISLAVVADRLRRAA